MAWVGSHASRDLRLTKAKAFTAVSCGEGLIKPYIYICTYTYPNGAFGGLVQALGGLQKMLQDLGFEMSGSGMQVWKVPGVVLSFLGE